VGNAKEAEVPLRKNMLVEVQLTFIEKDGVVVDKLQVGPELLHGEDLLLDGLNQQGS